MRIIIFEWLLIATSSALIVPNINKDAVLKSNGISNSRTSLLGKKKKKGQAREEKASVKEARLDAATRQFMFSILNLSKVLPDKSKEILKKINLCFYPGAKIGVVGANGSGKSTLLKIMAGLDTEFEGTARPLPGSSIGYLPQEPVLEGKTVGECVESAVASGRKTLDRFNELSVKLADPELDAEETERVMEELTVVSDEIEARNLWDLERWMERAMDALRVPRSDAETAVLSGGEKRRVSLCGLLLADHDMLLLDEPTNHLDAESIAWLEEFLARYRGTVVCITHDRYFLENVAQWILELDRGQGIPFEGNYSAWLEAKNNRLAQEKKDQSTLAKALHKELEWIRSTPKAKTKITKARLNRYDDLLAAAPPNDVRSAGQIYIPPGPRLGDVVIDVHGLTKAYHDRLLIHNLHFSLPKAAIVGIIGPNGAGKSTLIRILTGKETPDSGTITIGSTVRIVSVTQDRNHQLTQDPHKTVFDEITAGATDISLGPSLTVPSRAYVSWFGFKSQQQQQKVVHLSGGERNRVQLAKLFKTGANLIILDEPTNDLDVETLRSLEDALLNFAGCALVVSHDRYFLDRIATHILAFEGDSKCFFFQGNYAEYEENRLKRLGETTIKRIKYAPLVNA